MNIIIIGAGAAGFFSAIHNKMKYPQAKVIIIEKSNVVLAKVKISGGGRCNVTHACFDPKELVKHYPRGAKALLGAFYSFGPTDTIDFFESRGVSLKTEVDGRMFPKSNSSQSISDCLVDTAKNLGVLLWTGCSVEKIIKIESGFSLSLMNGQTHACDKLILATGSSKSGYEFAAELGHTIVNPVPSLFTFAVADKSLHELSGLSVQRARTWIHKKQAQEGPLLVTHWGFSGPVIIKLSAWHARELFDYGYKLPFYVSWLPGYSLEQIRQVIMMYQKNSPKKTMCGFSPFQEIPTRLWTYLVSRSGLPDTKLWQDLGVKQLSRLVEDLHISRFECSGKGVFKEEFVTCGGVDLSEINFKTMESKRCPRLYIVGELLDCDGVTGGFNFQNAWTTGFLSA
jgi:predicted Rossmann fold flavoprotein